jgi:hypothetical protein
MEKRLVVSLLVIVGILGITIYIFGKKNGLSNSVFAGSPQPNLTSNKEINSKNNSFTIDGEKKPELIPDVAAYLVVLRFLSNRYSDEEKARGRSYVRHFLELQCNSCLAGVEEAKKIIENSRSKEEARPALERNRSEIKKALAQEEADIEVIMAAAEEFSQRIAILDSRVKEIKQRNGANSISQILPELSDLQMQKEAIAIGIVTKMKERLSPVVRDKFDRQINEHVKRKIRLIRSPTSLDEERQRFELKTTRPGRWKTN